MCLFLLLCLPQRFSRRECRPDVYCFARELTWRRQWHQAAAAVANDLETPRLYAARDAAAAAAQLAERAAAQLAEAAAKAAASARDGVVTDADDVVMVDEAAKVAADAADAAHAAEAMADAIAAIERQRATLATFVELIDGSKARPKSIARALHGVADREQEMLDFCCFCAISLLINSFPLFSPVFFTVHLLIDAETGTIFDVFLVHCLKLSLSR